MVQPVQVKAIPVWWYLNTDEGKEYLNALANAENMGLFLTKSNNALIVFMWNHYKSRILAMVMIPFIIYLALFTALVELNAYYFNKAKVTITGAD